MHISGLDKGFLSSLGERFLSLLYLSFDECDESTLIVEQSNGHVIGFIAGGQGMKPILLNLLRHFPTLILALGINLLNPVKFWAILEILFLAGKKVQYRGIYQYPPTNHLQKVSDWLRQPVLRIDSPEVSTTLLHSKPAFRKNRPYSHKLQILRAYFA